MKSLTARLGGAAIGIAALFSQTGCAAPPIPIEYKPPAIERFDPAKGQSEARKIADYGRCLAELKTYRDKRYGEKSGKTIVGAALADGATGGIFSFSGGAISQARDVDIGIESTAKKGFDDCMGGYNLKPDDAD